MKIAVRGGHSVKCQGANGYINEYKECQKVSKAVIETLLRGGLKVVNCNNNGETVSQELSLGTNKANKENAELYIPIHMNAYKKVHQPMGFEILVYNKNSIPTEAKRVSDTLKKLGFKSRGFKERKDLHDLRTTKMKAFLIELCFCDSIEDTQLYNKLGSAKIGEEIAYAIMGKRLEENKPSDKAYRVQVGYFKEKKNADKLVKELKSKGYEAFVKEV